MPVYVNMQSLTQRSKIKINNFLKRKLKMLVILILFILLEIDFFYNIF